MIAKIFVFAALIVVVSSAALGQTQQVVLMGAGDQLPAVEDMVDAMTPDPQLTFRGARSRSSGPATRRELKATPFDIRFEFDSSILTPLAEELLRRLADALVNDSLRDFEFRVDGHTDAVGGVAYNQTLSLQRANAVSDFLKQHGVNAQRMSVKGWGEARLLDRDNTLNEINRRVEIVTMLSTPRG